MRSVRDFGLCSSERLRGAALQLLTDVSGQRKCPILKVEICAEMSITNYEPNPCNIPEKGIYDMIYLLTAVG